MTQKVDGKHPQKIEVPPDGCDAWPHCNTCPYPCTETQIAEKVGKIRQQLIANAERRKNPNWKNDL
jgi:hypothetical protein